MIKIILHSSARHIPTSGYILTYTRCVHDGQVLHSATFNRQCITTSATKVSPLLQRWHLRGATWWTLAVERRTWKISYNRWQTSLRCGLHKTWYFVYLIVVTGHVHAPPSRHLLFAKMLVRYISGSKYQGLFYWSNRNSSSKLLTKYVDADCARSQDTRKSTTGFLITFDNGMIRCKSKIKALVSLISAKS